MDIIICCFCENTGAKVTIFYLITAHTLISTQSRNSVVFRLQPVYVFFIKAICCGYSFELHRLVVPTTYAFL